MAQSETDSYFPLARNINGYYFFNLFNNLAFWLPVYAIFFLRQGLDYSMLLILYGIDTVVQTILEIPSGLLADRLGRRLSLMLAALAQAGGFLIIAFGNALPWYMVGMALHGAALALASGADSAIIYDSLLAAGQEGEFKKIEGRAYMYNLLGWGLGGLLGGLVATKSLVLPFALTGFSALLAFFTAAMMTEPPRVQKSDEKRPKNTGMLIRQALRVVREKASVRAIIVFASIIIGLLLVAHKFSQPYLERADINLEFFGVIYFGWLMFAALSSRFSDQIEKYLGSTVYFLSLPVLSGIALIYMWWWQNPYGAAIAVLYQFAWGSLRPQMFQIINAQVSSVQRATILSLVGFGSSLVYIVMVPITGFLSDRYDFPLALLIIGLAIIIFGLGAGINLLTKIKGYQAGISGERPKATDSIIE